MATGMASWSQTASSNDDADANVNWAEGQAPSSVNDSARAMMASAAKWRDDNAGSLTTGGTSTAYTLTSNQTFGSLSEMDGHTVVFKVDATSGASPTLNVDSLGAKALHAVGGTALPSGALIANGIYAATYDNSNSRFVVHGGFGAMPNGGFIPIGAMMDYWGSSAPSGWLLCHGQAVSRTTYAALFAAISTVGGVGDGSTTFNIPDCRGRVVAGQDDMGGTSANRLTNADDGLDGDTLGATGGGETQTLVTANLPAYTPSGSISAVQPQWDGPTTRTALAVTSDGTPATQYWSGNTPTNTTSVTPTFTGAAQGGTSTAFGIVQPTIIANKIIYTGVYS